MGPTGAFYIADTLVSNDWNFGSPATAGIIGIGKGSPVWNWLDYDGSGEFHYSIQFTNNTDWTFADPTFVPKIAGNSLILGQSSMSYFLDMPVIAITPTASNSALYSLEYFGFGVSNSSTEYYRSIINNEQEYGIYRNTTKITTDFRGVGLPTASYAQFANLLEIASEGQVNCAKVQGGYCVLPKTCDNYPKLWTYKFKIEFTTGHNYLEVPLASFAALATDKNSQNFCAIYVE